MKKKEHGVLTAEASIVLTLCLLFILFLFSFIRVYNAQSLVSHAVLQSSDAMAFESYLREETLNGSEEAVTELANRFLETVSVGADSYTSLRSADIPKIAKEKFVYAIGSNEAEADKKLKSLGIKDGLAGIDFSGSYMDIGNDDVVVCVSYTVKMQVGVLGMNEIPITKTAKSKTFGDILFTISVVPENAYMGSASGSGNYKYGEQVQIAAMPNYGYKFKNWSDGSTDNPRTVTVTDSKTYIAVFEENDFGINIISSPTDGGTTTGAGAYKYSDIATVSATPTAGYRFTSWSVYGHNDKTVRAEYNSTVTLTVDQSYTCTANFKPNSYTVKTKCEGVSNNSYAVAVYGSDKYQEAKLPYKTAFKLTASNIKGYRFVGWKTEGASSYFSTSLSVDQTVPACDVTYIACYESTKRTVTFYNKDGSTYAIRTVDQGRSLGSNMPNNPKSIGYVFGGWSKFNKNTKVYNDIAVYGVWKTCVNHRLGDCGVVHEITPTSLTQHRSVKTFKCMCIVCADCGCYLDYRNNKWVKSNGRKWKTPNGSIYISPTVWCIEHIGGNCESYKNRNSAGTYRVH